MWNIKNLTDFWGIGKRTALRLEKLYIRSVKDLANANPDLLKKEFGIIGVQLWFHANGVDESNLSKPYIPQTKGLGTSQVLPRNYENKEEIKIVLSEMVEEIATKLRKQNKQTTSIFLHIGYSYTENKKDISISKKINPTNSTKELTEHILSLFYEKYDGKAVRNLGIRFDKLTDKEITVYTIFDDIKKIEKIKNLENTVDQIREKYGYLSVQKATSLMKGSRVRERNSLIGGHDGGERNDK